MGEVYRLLFPNGMAYIGITTRGAERRFRWHAGHARQARYQHVPVYKAWAEQGAPTLELLETGVPEDKLFQAEVRLIALHNTLHPHGYNSTTGGSGGTTVSEETRRRMAVASTGRKHTPETRERIALAKSGNSYGSANKGRKPVVHSCTSKPKSTETRAKISAALMGSTHTPETRAKMSASRIGKPRSAETRAKISAGHARRRATSLEGASHV